MTKLIALICTVAFLFTACVFPAEAAEEETVKFLFIGNSSTYYNDTPLMFKFLCESAGMKVQVDQSVYGYAYLEEFADETLVRSRDGGKPGVDFRDKLNKTKYDYVVFQGGWDESFDSMSAALNILLPYVERNGAEAIMYMRYGSDVNEQDKHHVMYTNLAKRYNLRCAPLADAFKIAMSEYPSITMMHTDNAHQSYNGGYLIACVWLYAITGKDPRGLSYKGVSSVSAANAVTLQNIAYRAVNEYDFDNEPFTEMPTASVDGKSFNILSLGKPYEISGVTDDYSTTYPWGDIGGEGFRLNKLTDGVLTYEGTEVGTAAFNGNKATIVVDLLKEDEIRWIKTDVFGGTLDVSDPSTAVVKGYYSTDGVNYSPVTLSMSKEWTGGNWKSRVFSSSLPAGTKARYIKFDYTVGGSKLIVSETAAYGVEGTGEEEKQPGMLSLDKAYSCNGTRYTNEDYNDVDASGVCKNKLTNGAIALKGDSAPIGAYNCKNMDVVIDLGKRDTITSFYTDVWGGQWGVPDPASATVSVSVSDDGNSFKTIGELNKEDFPLLNWKRYLFTLDAPANTAARYVKFSYTVVGGNFIWTSEAAVFGFEGAEEPVSPRELGDINGNRKIDASDYLLLKRHVLKTYTLSDEQAKKADLNGNGKIEAADYLLLKRAVLGTYVIK